MSNLTVFQFEQNEVRFVGTVEKPEWVAADIIAILYPEAAPSSYNKYLSKIPAHKKGKNSFLTPGGEQEVTTLLEGGFYRLVMRSNSPLASKFQDWVEDEVLPTIRKTGSYALPQPQKQSQPALPDVVPTPAEISEVVDLMLGNTDLHPNLIAGAKGNAIALVHPQLLSTIESAKALLSVSVEAELVRPTALALKLTETTGEHWTAIRVNKLLVDQGFQIKNPDGKNPAYLPTEKGKEYSQLVLDTARGRDKTIQSLQWHLSVLEVLETNDSFNLG